jgi:hypothetical protein
MLAFAWRQGELVARVVVAGVIALLLILALLTWQGLRLHHRIDGLTARVARLQSTLASKTAAVQAAQAPDVVQTLPDPPAAAQIMQTLQQAADKEGAQVESLQADDRPATGTALGHLDLTLSIKAPYPSIVVVLQQVLDRYPGATLKQIDLAHAAPPTAAVPTVTTPTGGSTTATSLTPSEARVLLSFWRRPTGVAQAIVATTPLPSSSGAEVSPAAASSFPPASAVSLVPLAAASGARSNSGAR